MTAAQRLKDLGRERQLAVEYGARFFANLDFDKICYHLHQINPDLRAALSNNSITSYEGAIDFCDSVPNIKKIVIAASRAAIGEFTNAYYDREKGFAYDSPSNNNETVFQGKLAYEDALELAFKDIEIYTRALELLKGEVLGNITESK